jgi:integrase
MYFNLKEPNKNKDTLIILRYYISKKEGRFVFSTGLTIHPDLWDFDNKIVKLKRGRSDLSSIKRKLQNYLDYLEKCLNNFELNNIKLTKELLKEEFLKEFKKDQVKSKFIYLSDFTDDFIERAPTLTNRNTKKKYNTTKIKHYKKSINRFKEFEIKRGLKIRLDNFTLNIYDEFVDYLLNDKKYAVNSAGDIIKNIKVFLKKADEFSYDVHSDYKDSNFTVLKEDSISVALNESEIESIFKHDFTDNLRLQNTRDLAVIGLWTGLRVSDFLSLLEIKKEDKFISVKTQKTGAKVVIPLHHHIKEVIEKRGMPKMITDVKFNLYIKDVCRAVGLKDNVKGSLMVKDKKNDIFRKKQGIYPKYKLISSHTCRRSFATNLYKMNFPTLSIMQITGHKTERSFLTYIKVTPTEHAEKLLKHWEEYYKE